MEQRVNARMIVLHSVWTEGRLHFWAESAKGAAEFVVPIEELAEDEETDLGAESFDESESEGDAQADAQDEIQNEGGVAVQIEIKLADHPFAVASDE